MYNKVDEKILAVEEKYNILEKKVDSVKNNKAYIKKLEEKVNKLYGGRTFG